MPIEAPITAAHFYDPLPASDHRTGDIWRDLPTFGNLGRSTTSGIVITPACDLAQEKCETITYLPILSVDEYLGSSAFRYECWLEIQPLLARLPGYSGVALPGRYELMVDADLDNLINVDRDIGGKVLQTPESNRLKAYYEYVKAAAQGAATATHLRGFIKSEKLTAQLGRLVTNALKADVHFLPRDGKPATYSAVPEHSVILFRYPLTIPVVALTAAQNLTDSQWVIYCQTGQQKLPILKQIPNWPIKLATLRGEFLSDMLARYVNMYIRLGSSDFTEQAVLEISGEIGVMR